MSPMIVRHMIGLLCASVAVALALTWRLSDFSDPGRSSMYGALSAALFLALVGVLAPLLTAPNRPHYRSGGVVVRLRWIEPVKSLIGMMLTLTAMAFCGVVGDVPGPRGSSSLTWAVWLFLLAWVSGYVLAQQPWRRELVLTDDVLTLRNGARTEVIVWDRIQSFDSADPDPAHSSSSRLLTAHATLTMRVTPQPRRAGSSRHQARLHSRFPIGGMAMRPDALLAALRHLHGHPADRALLSDRADAEQLFARIA